LQQELPFLARQKHRLVRQPEEHSVDVLHTEAEKRVSGFLDRLKAVKSDRVTPTQDLHEHAKSEARKAMLDKKQAKVQEKKDDALRERIKRRKFRDRNRKD